MNEVQATIKDVVLMKLEGASSINATILDEVRVAPSGTFNVQAGITGQIPVCTEVPFDTSVQFKEALAVKNSDSPLKVDLTNTNALIEAITSAASAELSFNDTTSLNVSVTHKAPVQVAIPEAITVTLADTEKGLAIRALAPFQTETTISSLPTINTTTTLQGEVNATITNPIQLQPAEEKESLFYVLLESAEGKKKSCIQYNSGVKTLSEFKAWIDDEICRFKTAEGVDILVLDYRFTK